MKPFNRCATLTLISALASLLTACGGGGGGGGGPTYDVSGTITGLTSSGLVLQNNGGGSQNIAANSTSFQFTSLVNGSAYAITVETQPSGETCTVANGGGSISGANVSTVSVSCTSPTAPNAVSLSVNPGPASADSQTFNDLLASVSVCQPNSNTCVTINNVLLDTGSQGLRLMKSVLVSAGLTLTPMPDPNNGANTISECLPFADGYTWGAVALAGIKLSSESVASIPVQIIDDSALPSPAAPDPSCTSNGSSLNSIDAFDANGVLGVGVFVQDCGAACQDSALPNIYYSCSGSGVCTSIPLTLADQVANPVASFATDNNGVIVQLSSVSATGAATASGVLVFGIGTEANNGLGDAEVLTANASGYFTTTFDGQTLTNSFIDSGSNALFFPDSSLSACPSPAQQFYCPGSASSLSSQSLTATNQGANGTISSVDFSIVNLDYLSTNDGSNFALDDVGGPAAQFNNVSNYFDWGLPFLYGRTVYFAIEGKSASGTSGPYYAY